jgi:hypothetical protein
LPFGVEARVERHLLAARLARGGHGVGARAAGHEHVLAGVVDHDPHALLELEAALAVNLEAREERVRREALEAGHRLAVGGLLTSKLSTTTRPSAVPLGATLSTVIAKRERVRNAKFMSRPIPPVEMSSRDCASKR